MSLRQPFETFYDGIEKCTEDTRAFGLECCPQLCFGPPALFRNWLQGKEYRAVSEIRPGHDLLDAVQNYRASGVKSTSSWSV